MAEPRATQGLEGCGQAEGIHLESEGKPAWGLSNVATPVKGGHLFPERSAKVPGRSRTGLGLRVAVGDTAAFKWHWLKYQE